MALPIIKTVALAVSGFGVATGGIGGGYYFLVKPTVISKAISQTEKTEHLDSVEVGDSSAVLPESSSAEVSAVSTTIATDSDDHTEQDEEDLEDQESKISGSLALVRGNQDILENAYILKTYQDSSELEEDKVVVSDIFFSDSEENLNRQLRHFNSGFWLDSDELKEYLEKLKEQKASFEKLFKGNVYLELISKIQSLVNS
ncbi:hypothetical protein MHLP_02100 [Candidatus Mycoplasma haematolamae str. Purdue]|uniref:Uncharacterized protein n=1 Tax=Mycoplasma haematolamae (strain Purdue) TaxID=1212765 RepID=I7B9R6_MYCHA|nr:hypothetical protein [Candidatus Mycoplasma haematolamae]AFO52000.1 hypothetical protein MHLP_02100 [Candidatus Mycoplasma haematolamae str. Purdue]